MTAQNAEPIADDRKNAQRWWHVIERNAYSGNMLIAIPTLARMLAEQRERDAGILEDTFPEAAMMLRLYGRPVSEKTEERSS